MENKNFKPNDNFVYYLYFIKERMNIFWRKYNGGSEPYSDDEILQKYKFTNAYRVLDRSSQYMVKNVIYNGVKYSREDMFWRILIYKHFNLPQTWEYLVSELGDITLSTKTSDIIDSTMNLNGLQAIYSPAYTQACPMMRKDYFLEEFSLQKTSKKNEIYLTIFDKEFKERNKMGNCLESKSFEDLVNRLKNVLSFGDFISYQIAQDLNYSNIVDFDMNSFNSAGGGTINGIKRTFDLSGKVEFGDIVVWVFENMKRLQEEYSNKFDIDLEYKPLPNYKLQVPDLSNCFCETDKYLRGKGFETKGIEGKRIKCVYKESPNKIEYMFPPKWGVGNL